MDLVIVESPAKAKTINKYLGNDYKVLASFGHVRDLPEKNGSVDPDEEFSMIWEVQSASGKRLNEIADYLKKSDRLILATDPDREGEAISWHVLEVMREKGVLDGKQIQRVVFNAITRNAVTEAMNHPRELDEKLVHAYLARRALDYLVGFNLSPVLWRKTPRRTFSRPCAVGGFKTHLRARTRKLKNLSLVNTGRYPLISIHKMVTSFQPV
jgi:DNA topoisomerase-1